MVMLLGHDHRDSVVLSESELVEEEEAYEDDEDLRYTPRAVDRSIIE